MKLKTSIFGLLVLTMMCRPSVVAQGSTLTQSQPSKAQSQIWSQLWAIDYRHFQGLNEYLSRCDRVRVLIPAMDEFYKSADAKLQRLRVKFRDNPELTKLGDFYSSLNAVDQAGLRLLRKEMGLASEMSKLSVEDRQNFFDKKIRPLENAEDKLSEQEIEMVKTARNSGMQIPEYIGGGLNGPK